MIAELFAKLASFFFVQLTGKESQRKPFDVCRGAGGLPALNLAIGELKKAEENPKFGRHVLITLWCVGFVKKLSCYLMRFCLVLGRLLFLR